MQKKSHFLYGTGAHLGRNGSQLNIEHVRGYFGLRKVVVTGQMPVDSGGDDLGGVETSPSPTRVRQKHAYSSPYMGAWRPLHGY